MGEGIVWRGGRERERGSRGLGEGESRLSVEEGVGERGIGWVERRM